MIQTVMELETEVPRKSVFLMNGDQIDDHWHNIALLMKECPGYYDYYTPEWTYERAKSGDLQLWAISDGAIRGIVVSQILVYPVQKVFEIIGAAGIGLLEFFDEMESVFEFIAADAGCSTIAARCRPGIARMLRKKHVFEYSIWCSRPVSKRRRH